MGKTLEKITLKDHIVFLDPTDGLIVTTPTEIYKDGTILVHYLYSGYKSTSTILKREEILAIGNSKGKETIQSLGGEYTILQREKLEEALAKDK